jgi:hypothetical protein
VVLAYPKLLTCGISATTLTPGQPKVRGATTHDESANLVRQFIQGQVYSNIAAGLAEPDAELRIDLAMAQLLGIAYLRHILQVEPVASAPVEELINRVAPVISRHLSP